MKCSNRVDRATCFTECRTNYKIIGDKFQDEIPLAQRRREFERIYKGICELVYCFEFLFDYLILCLFLYSICSDENCLAKCARDDIISTCGTEKNSVIETYIGKYYGKQ